MEYILMAVKYNNYYNRVLKVEKDISEYEDLDPNPYYEQGVYFNFGDGVNTTQVLNDSVEDKDYLILVDGNGNIHSRWFIIDTQYELNGQQTLTLRRDLLADFSNTVLYSTAFIEKGYLQPTNKLIFNKEQMTFNQVKTEELLLKDSTNIPWIVGYYPNNAIISGTAKLPNTEYDEVVNSNFSEWQYYALFNLGVMEGNPRNQTFRTYNTGATNGNSHTLRTDVRPDYTGGIAVKTDYVSSTPTNIYTATANTALSAEDFQKRVTNKLLEGYNDYCNLLFSEIGIPVDMVETVTALNNKRVRFNDGIKTLHVIKSDDTGGTFHNADPGGNLNARFIRDYSSVGINITPQVGKAWIRAEYLYDTYTLSYDTISSGEYTYAIGENHYTLKDAPYSMFCMPYGSMTITEGSNSYHTDKDIQLAVATNMAEASGNIYDIQILPYCPLTEIQGQAYTVTDNRAYDVIKSGDNTVGFIFHCQSSSFTKRISLGELPSWLVKKSDPVEVKVQNECEMIRFNSPNYASSWEMSVAKNEGISWINVSATYLPYNPYIKVYPDFKGLYGDDFNDNRGLILSGEFSIPIVTDQWKTYQLQNKNYEAMFNREIKNLDIQQNMGRIQDWIGLVTGGLQAAGTGAALGAAGGPMGTTIGAGVSSALSIGAGIGDLVINNTLRDEAKSYKTDMYNFQLGNIQALPNTLSKTTAYTIDNKYFPFIEYYAATAVERKAFRDKLTYNGMTVGVIGRFYDYIKPAKDTLTYVKGQLIRLQSIGDMHIANQLAAEMQKGVYINGSITTGI